MNALNTKQSANWGLFCCFGVRKSATYAPDKLRPAFEAPRLAEQFEWRQLNWTVRALESEKQTGGGNKFNCPRRAESVRLRARYVPARSPARTPARSAARTVQPALRARSQSLAASRPSTGSTQLNLARISSARPTALTSARTSAQEWPPVTETSRSRRAEPKGTGARLMTNLLASLQRQVPLRLAFISFHSKPQPFARNPSLGPPAFH